MSFENTGLKNVIVSPRDFERLLREEGFSRARAKAITAKGFRTGFSPDDSLAAQTVKMLNYKRCILDLETKSSGRLEFVAGPSWNDDWRVLGVISPRVPSSFRITARTLNLGRKKGAFLVRVRYNSRHGRRTATWLSNGGAAGNGRYYVNEGMQEILVKAMAPGIPQRVEVK